MLVKAHESLLRATDLLEVISNLRDGLDSLPSKCGGLSSPTVQQSLVELGRVWQAPLYEITLKFHPTNKQNVDGGWFCFTCSSYISQFYTLLRKDRQILF